MAGLALAAMLEVSLLGAGGDELSAALERSANSGRPTVALLGATWCPGCRVMKDRVLPEVSRAGGLKNVEFVYIDVDAERALAGQLLKGSSIPQMVRFEPTSQGWNREYLTGAHNAQKVSEFISGQPASPLKLSSWFKLP
ncbi:MAG: thioredoxin family protein [Planctomycetota bacterium]